MNGGRLLAFEGLDGAGKSTQVERLAAALRLAGYEVVTTGEPTDGRWGRRIREMTGSGEAVPAEQQLAWFTDDRRDHVREVIAPALAAGRIVITDRYYLSTAAYQGAGGLDAEDILARSEAEFPLPDLALLLEVDAAGGLARVRERGARIETVFEREEFLSVVAEQYRRLDRPYLVRIEAAGTPDAVARAIADCVRERLGTDLP